MKSHEFLNETSEEILIINLISRRLAGIIIKTMNKTPGFVDFLLDTEKQSRYRDLSCGISVAKAGLPEVANELVAGVLKSVKIYVNEYDLASDKDLKGAVGSYNPEDRMIRIDLAKMKAFVKKTGGTLGYLLSQTIAHELTHALDDAKMAGRASLTPTRKLDVKTYLAQPSEINARVTQAMMDLVDLIEQGMKPEQLKRSIVRCLEHEQLTPEVVGSGYNRIVSRLYKFFDAYTNSPKKIEPLSLKQRIKSMFTDAPNSIIK